MRCRRPISTITNRPGRYNPKVSLVIPMKSHSGYKSSYEFHLWQTSRYKVFLQWTSCEFKSQCYTNNFKEVDLHTTVREYWGDAYYFGGFQGLESYLLSPSFNKYSLLEQLSIELVWLCAFFIAYAIFSLHAKDQRPNQCQFCNSFPNSPLQSKFLFLILCFCPVSYQRHSPTLLSHSISRALVFETKTPL